MQIANPHYMEGWTDLAREVQNTIHQSIQSHNEAKTPQDMLAVINDVITFTHRMNLILAMYNDYLAEEADKSEIEGRILYLAVNNDEKE